MSSSQGQYKKLQNDIRNHDHAYYILDDPEISDGEYDALFQNLLKRFTGLTVYKLKQKLFNLF